MIEVQCTSCHTRYRLDEQVLPEGLPTFKCSRCGHVFTFEPRKSRLDGRSESAASKLAIAAESSGYSSAHGARLPDGKEPSLDAAVGVARAGPSSSSQDSLAAGAAGASDISGRSLADPDSPRFQSESAKDEALVGERQQAVPHDPETPRPPRDEPDSAEATRGAQPPLPPQLRAKQDENFHSRLLTGKDPDVVSGENLSFDFADEEPAPDQARLARRGRRQGPTTQAADRDSARWEVGDDESTPAVERSRDGMQFKAEMPRRSRRQMRADDPEAQFSNDDAFIDAEEEPVYHRAKTHSARFFLLLIFLAGAGFGALTLFIHNAPSRASAVLSYLPVIGDRFVTPATPAKLVALRDVNAVYQHGKEGQNTLVISGTAENVGTASLRLVQLTAALRDAQRRALASQAVYCGNSVSTGMIGQMTPHEIEFFQKLEPAGTFALEPSATCRFVAVFMNPPGAARDYDVSVSQAVPGAAQTTDDPES
jgi:predicted Zn finger-like uncharacterized protein